jgi:chromosome segregation ATPase
MTFEEVERTMQFLLAQQAQFAADLTTWREETAASIASLAAWKVEATRKHEELRGVVADVAGALKEAAGLVRSLAESQAETARQQKETDHQLKETDKQVRETDRHMRETDRQVADLTRAVREIVESERETRNRVTALEQRDRRSGDNGPH